MTSLNMVPRMRLGRCACAVTHNNINTHVQNGFSDRIYRHSFIKLNKIKQQTRDKYAKWTKMIESVLFFHYVLTDPRDNKYFILKKALRPITLKLTAGVVTVIDD